ncbi:MAG TPA: threonine ammonia-lyase, biosynthetic [Terriglobia bacterium]|nr:threonine ammonia-lyase, biosynthetic [Terriglobia bacterium]
MEASAALSVNDLLREILTSRVYEAARETPLDFAPRLSSRLDASVWLKREDQQPVFSFKLRGAYNRMARLSAQERNRGVITASAGNHAQGVALSARRLQIKAVIVMPKTTPAIKVEAVRALGGEIVLVGDHYSEAQAHCDQLAVERGMTFVHPFDDPLVIAGQGTIADEIVRRCPEGLSAIFVPVGGGGLIAGIGAYVKALLPGKIKVIGVQPRDSDAMRQSLVAGSPVTLDHVGLFADGVAVRKVGRHTFPIVQSTVEEIIVVSNDEICAAMKDVFDDTRVIAEPAGALAVAGLKAYVARSQPKNRNFAAILSGANVNFDRLRFVAERAELGESREALIAVTIPERKGAFRQFCATLGARVVTEFNYRLNSRDRAEIFVGLSVENREDTRRVLEGLNAQGYESVDLTDNEMAKLHVRYMVGGRANAAGRERVCRFEFPERPGALLQFLDTLGGRWNISLFHYRNHGADFGRVLAAFEVPPGDDSAFDGFLSALGYAYQFEDGDDAYRLFLGK